MDLFDDRQRNFAEHPCRFGREDMAMFHDVSIRTENCINHLQRTRPQNRKSQLFKCFDICAKSRAIYAYTFYGR